MIKVLLVEDNEKISGNIVEYFKDEMDIKNVYNGREAIDYLELYDFDIIILDLMLPEIDGMGVLKHMSKKGIYKQLTSEYGEGFPEDAAQYAIDNIKADWNANALEKAKSYYENMSMSKSAVYDQLISEYGEKFTESEAQYAIDHLDN